MSNTSTKAIHPSGLTSASSVQQDSKLKSFLQQHLETHWSSILPPRFGHVVTIFTANLSHSGLQRIPGQESKVCAGINARDAIPKWFASLSSWEAAQKQHPCYAHRCSEKSCHNTRVLQPFLTCLLNPMTNLIRWDKSQKDFKCGHSMPCHCLSGLGMSICGGSLLAVGFISILWELHLDLTFSKMFA